MFPAELLTERLILRPLKSTDAPEIFTLRSNAENNRYLDRPRAASIKDAASFISKIAALTNENQTFYRGITVKDKDELIGTITLWNFDQQNSKAEIGYELLPAFQGKGYMLEAAQAVIRFAFEEVKFSVIEGWTHPQNEASNTLLEKLGFKRDIEAEKNKPADVQEIIYSLYAGHY